MDAASFNESIWRKTFLDLLHPSLSAIGLYTLWAEIFIWGETLFWRRNFVNIRGMQLELFTRKGDHAATLLLVQRNLWQAD